MVRAELTNPVKQMTAELRDFHVLMCTSREWMSIDLKPYLTVDSILPGISYGI